MFGYSRGARQVQVLADLIDRRGIPHCEVDTAENDAVDTSCREASTIFADYKKKWRKAKEERARTGNRELVPVWPERAGVEAKIEFVGIWDCIETLASNLKQAFASRDFKRTPYLDHEFYPYTLPGNVNYAFHAMAIDERRGLYPVIKWRDLEEIPGKKEQVWFPGSHGDVGGGYPRSETLSGLSLNWMISNIPDPQLLPGGCHFRVTARVDGYSVNSKDYKLTGGTLSFFKADHSRYYDFWASRNVTDTKANISEANEDIRPRVHTSVLDRMCLPQVYEWKCRGYAPYRPEALRTHDYEDENAYRAETNGAHLRALIEGRITEVKDKQCPSGR